MPLWETSSLLVSSEVLFQPFFLKLNCRIRMIGMLQRLLDSTYCMTLHDVLFFMFFTRPPDPIERIPWSRWDFPVGSQGRCASSYFSSTFFVLWCVEQVRFLVPVIRELMALVRAYWNIEFLLYSACALYLVVAFQLLFGGRQPVAR